MKRPGPVVYLFGNPLSVVALFGALAYCAYQWWTNGWSLWAPFLALLAVSYAMRASDQLAKFNRWQREWQAMEGRAPGASLGRLVPSWRILGGIVGLGGGGFLLLAAPNTPDVNVARGLVVLAVLIGVLGTLYRRVRRGRTQRSEATSRDVAVTVCVALLRQRPTLAQAYAALPAYCGRLLK